MSPVATVIIAGACGVGMLAFLLVFALCEVADHADRAAYRQERPHLSAVPPCEANQFEHSCWEARDLRPASGVHVTRRTGAASTARSTTRR